MEQQNRLQKGSLGLWSIIFFVIAAASPLTGVVGSLPIAFLAGNGAGVPGVFLIAGMLLIMFSFGFVAMSRYVVNAGAFYAYIAQGLGIRSGMAGLGVALLAYTVIQLSVTAMFGFFASQFVQAHTGIMLPWWGFSLAMQIIVGLLGVAKVELGGKILGLLMLLEVGIVLLTDTSMLHHHHATFEFSSFTPHGVFQGAIGIALVFAVCSFVGFEASAIYSEECRDPQKNIPRATLFAVVLITLFFALTSWTFVQYTGAEHIVDMAAKDPGMFVLNIANDVLGPWAAEMMSVLLITSLFAATQAFHNTLSRYLFAMSRDGLLWRKMAKTHPSFQTPYIASMVQMVVMVVATLVCALCKLDPMVDVFSWASALGSLAILLLQLGVSLAVMAYFIRHPAAAVSLWSRLIAPLISAAGMLATIIMVINNLNVLSGSSSPLVTLLPWLVISVALLGFIGACYLERINPQRYLRIGQVVTTL
jgi:amino acid transporter